MISLEESEISLPNETSNAGFVKIRGKAKNYDHFCSFKSLTIAENCLSGTFCENQWTHKKTTDTLEGIKKWFHCKQKKCPVVMQLVLSKESKVTLMLRDNQHNHIEEPIESKEYGIDLSTKLKIQELISLGCKPGKILIELRKAELKVPLASQLYNYSKYMRKDQLGSTTISLNDLKQWAESRMAIPEDDDKVFVGLFNYETTPSKNLESFYQRRIKRIPSKTCTFEI